MLTAGRMRGIGEEERGAASRERRALLDHPSGGGQPAVAPERCGHVDVKRHRSPTLARASQP
jgi:hypothetical protein